MSDVEICHSNVGLQETCQSDCMSCIQETIKKHDAQIRANAIHEITKSKFVDSIIVIEQFHRVR